MTGKPERRSWWRRAVDAILDALPPGSRDEDALPRSSAQEAAHRRLRLKLHLLEKRGRGGYR